MTSSPTTNTIPRTDSKLQLFPKAVAAVTSEGHLLGLNDAIPASLDSKEEIRPINPNDPFFMDIVMHSATFVLAYAAHKVLPAKSLGVRHGFCLENSPLMSGYYVDALDGVQLTDDEFAAISASFKAVLGKGLPIVPVDYHEAAVLEKLMQQGSTNSYNLLKSKSIRESYRCYEIDGFVTLRRVPLAPTSSIFDLGHTVQLVKEGRGLIVRLDSMAPIPRSQSIDDAFARAVNWGNATQTGSIGEINEKVLNKPEPFILLEESRFDNEVVACATAAITSRPGLKVVLISGPSASGKTTFAHKLALSFRGMGKEPTVMSTDDYYKDSADPDYPKQPNGQLDFEVLEALRLDVLRQHLGDLMAGKPIEAPIFDFVAQKPAEHGRPLSLGSDGILIMEGIFTLDPRISEGIDQSGIFTIFISPMPFSFLDEQSFISNSNYRLIRRIARDYLHRGRDASASIKRLTSVNRGEYNAILPHIGNANYFFNSAMAHELPILSIMAVPLLRLVSPTDDVYTHAQQLLETLQHVSCCSDKYLNNASLLREFIGGSVFEEPPHVITSEQRPVTGTDEAEGRVLGTRVVPFLAGPTTIRDALVRTFPQVDLGVTVGAFLNGKMAPLSQAITVLDESDEMFLRPLLMGEKGAGSILRATCAFVLHVAVRRLWPSRRVVFAHGFGAEGGDISRAYLGRVYERTEEGAEEKSATLTSDDIAALTVEMRRLIDANAAIRVKTVSAASAIAYFNKAGMRYSTALLQSRNVPSVDVVYCEGEMALDMQPLAPSAGMLSAPDSFGLFNHFEGIALAFGVGHGSPASPSTPEMPTMSSARQEILRVSDFARRATRINCIGDMNKAVLSHQCGAVADVYHVTDHTRLSQLATKVKTEGKIRVIMIAGASFTGKTTFTSRLLVHLRGAGIPTREFGTEHYYKEGTSSGFPTRADGSWDFRSVEALDLEALQRDVDALLAGKAVTMYGYDVTKATQDKKKVKHVKGLGTDGGVVVIEGIFALRPEILSAMSRDQKLLIVEHPTSIINVDELRFVSHSVLRQLRRIVRDYYYNKRDARETLTKWDAFNEYEERNLVPYLDSADVMFNASSPYELGALRSTVLPLLEGISPLFPTEYAAAQQLRRMLEWCQDVPDMRMPFSSTIKNLMYGTAVTGHE